MNRPMTPGIIASGPKAIQVVVTAPTTGSRTAWVPRTAAAEGSSPSWTWAYTFSPTTIASSTIRPIAMIRANMLIMFSDMPVR